MPIDETTAAARTPAVDDPRAPETRTSRATQQKDFTKDDAAVLADQHGWTQLSAAEVPHYQRDDATHGRLSRWLRVRDPGLNGVVEYITVHWDNDGRWTGRAGSDRYQRGVNTATEWMNTIDSVVEGFHGEPTGDVARDGARRRRRSRSEIRLHAVPFPAD